MNLINIISAEEYQLRRRPSWPSYQALVDGKVAANLGDQSQIDALFDTGFKDYLDQHKSDDIAKGNQAAQTQIFYHKHVKDKQAQHCRVPWETLGVNSYGDIFICSSPAWIPKFVGNIFNSDDIFTELNSAMAQQIRQEIKNGTYFYCNLNLCDYPAHSGIQYARQPETDVDLSPAELEQDPDLMIDYIPRNVVFDFDHTCNYQCPSCRTGLINHNKHAIVRRFNNRIVDRLKTSVIDCIRSRPVTIRWAGGEPFISAPYLELLRYITAINNPRIDHVIQTNGSYLKRKSDLVTKLMPHTRELRISFDAATADTYHRVRVNGVWSNFLDNVTWILDQRRANGWSVDIVADFVIQKDNYREIPAFRALCDRLGIQHINWQKLWNWDTWSQAEFDDRNVHDAQHPEHARMLSMLAQVHP